MMMASMLVTVSCVAISGFDYRDEFVLIIEIEVFLSWQQLHHHYCDNESHNKIATDNSSHNEKNLGCDKKTTNSNVQVATVAAATKTSTTLCKSPSCHEREQ